MTSLIQAYMHQNLIKWDQLLYLQALKQLQYITVFGNPAMLKSKAHEFLAALCPSIQYIDGIEMNSTLNSMKSTFLKSADGKVMLTQARSHLTPAQRNVLNVTNASSPRRSRSANHRSSSSINPESNYLVNYAMKSSPAKLITLNSNDSHKMLSPTFDDVHKTDFSIIRSKSSDSPSIEPISIFKSSSKSSRTVKRITPDSSNKSFRTNDISLIPNEQIGHETNNTVSNKVSTDIINIWFGESQTTPLAASLNGDGTGFMKYSKNLKAYFNYSI
jgi:hypothetical protein